MSALHTGWTHQNRNLERSLFWDNVYLVYVRNMYRLDGTKQKPLQAIILDLDLNGKFYGEPFLPNILTARLVEHVEEHGESIVQPDLTGHDI